MNAGEDPAAALRSAVEARVTLLLGPTDAGKTWLTGRLATDLHRLGFRVAVVDADLGQSEIGPPTTIGLGHVAAPLSRLGDAEPIAMHWVGATSPHAHIEATARGCRRMVGRALALGFDRVLVDTSGLVEGAVGRVLKRSKIDLVRPDLLLCLERAGECEPILEAYRGPGAPVIRRLAVSREARHRSTEARRQHREAALRRYFRGSRPVVLDLARVAVLTPGGDPSDPEGALVGLLDAAGETLGLGRVLEISRTGGTLVLDTPASADEIATVAFPAGRPCPLETTR